MSIPGAAIEAAAEAIKCDRCTHSDAYYLISARAAIEAAMPHIREAIAQEIEAAYDRPDLDLLSARIVREGRP